MYLCVWLMAALDMFTPKKRILVCSFSQQRCLLNFSWLNVLKKLPLSCPKFFKHHPSPFLSHHIPSTLCTMHNQFLHEWLISSYREINTYKIFKNMALKIFNAINAGAEGWPPHSQLLLLSFFFLTRIVYLDAECLYDHIKQETFQTHTSASPQGQALVKQGCRTVQVMRQLQ